MDIRRTDLITDRLTVQLPIQVLLQPLFVITERERVPRQVDPNVIHFLTDHAHVELRQHKLQGFVVIDQPIGAIQHDNALSHAFEDAVFGDRYDRQETG
ncbi:hypothetical protein D1872_300060 [compost metagenome]